MTKTISSKKIHIEKAREEGNSIRTYLFLFGLCLIFFSRILVAIGFPSVIDFLHYVYFATIFLYSLIKSIILKQETGLQKYTIVLFCIILFSTILNGHGILNALISFLTISQPFILIYLCIGINKNILLRFLNAIFILNGAIAYIEYLILGQRVDDVQGLFIGMGAGAHICGAVSLVAIVFYLSLYKKTYKYFLCLFQAMVVFFSDNKQSLFLLLIALALVILFKRNKFSKKALQIALLLCICLFIYLLGLTAFPAILTYLNLEKVITGLEGKFIIFGFLGGKSNLFNYLFGFGAGTTVSRTAQKLVNYEFLSRFGATISEMQQEIWKLQESNWITNSLTGSSMFSLYFSFAGFYGDFGIIGLLFILFGYWTFIIKKCHSFSSKLILLFFLLHGLVFQWLEEPQFVAVVILFLVINNSIAYRGKEEKYYKKKR